MPETRQPNVVIAPRRPATPRPRYAARTPDTTRDSTSVIAAELASTGCSPGRTVTWRPLTGPTCATWLRTLRGSPSPTTDEVSTCGCAVARERLDRRLDQFLQTEGDKH